MPDNRFARLTSLASLEKQGCRVHRDDFEDRMLLELQFDIALDESLISHSTLDLFLFKVNESMDEFFIFRSKFILNQFCL